MKEVVIHAAAALGAATSTAGARNLSRKASIEFVDISGMRSMAPRTDVYAELGWSF